MSTKLTLRLDSGLIRRAKRYARASGKSLSRLVADYFALLEAPVERQGRGQVADARELPPLTRSLLGALSGSTLDEADYRRHLEEKYG